MRPVHSTALSKKALRERDTEIAQVLEKYGESIVQGHREVERQLREVQNALNLVTSQWQTLLDTFLGNVPSRPPSRPADEERQNKTSTKQPVIRKKRVTPKGARK